jgi:hypothetical protein
MVTRNNRDMLDSLKNSADATKLVGQGGYSVNEERT